MSKTELGGVRLQIRDQGKFITAHFKIEGKLTVFVAQMNKTLAAEHPELALKFKEFATECMKSMVSDAMKAVGVKDPEVSSVDKPPKYEH